MERSSSIALFKVKQKDKEFVKQSELVTDITD